MKTVKKFRFRGTMYKWTMTGWQATAIVMGAVTCMCAGLYATVLLSTILM